MKMTPVEIFSGLLMFFLMNIITFFSIVILNFCIQFSREKYKNKSNKKKFHFSVNRLFEVWHCAIRSTSDFRTGCEAKSPTHGCVEFFIYTFRRIVSFDTMERVHVYRNVRRACGQRKYRLCFIRHPGHET